VAFRNHDRKELRRIDLQLIAMMEDAQERLRSAGQRVYNKAFMMGFSASGTFTNMFSFVHPEIIRACSIGGGPPAVLNRDGPDWQFLWAGRTWGFATLTGNPFNLKGYRKIPQYIYVGDQDGNYTSGPALWDSAKAKYAAMGANAQFVIYPGIGHQYSPQMLTDLGNFFNENTEPTEVQLFTPNGGETFRYGETPLIEWGGPANDGGTLILKYTKNGGSTWKTITTLPGNPGNYPWEVPGFPSTKSKCKVKLILKDASGKKVGTDISDGVFTINP
jgi:hypothetical protein